jgi:hypothetical protein
MMITIEEVANFIQKLLVVAGFEISVGISDWTRAKKL